MMHDDTPLEVLNAYVDGELAPPEELELRRHLDGCQACRDRVETLLALKEAVAAGADTRPVPHTLRERLGALDRPAGLRRFGGSRRLLALAAGLVLAMGLASRLVLWPPARTDVVTEALVADHLHFLQVADVLEIASSDPRQVVAWFGDKVPFPVRVPTLDGAELLGGRLCALWGRQIALAFYDIQGTRMSLFVADAKTFPEDGPPPGTCRNALGDYDVCIVRTPSAVLALVGHKDRAAALLPQLASAAIRQP